MAQDPNLLAELLKEETRVWEALVAGDAEADGAALAEEFLGVYPDGFHGKASHVEQLADGPSVVEYRLSEARLVSAGDGFGLLVYRGDYLRPGREVWEAMYVSSLWRRDAGSWINVFSQDTPADPEKQVP